MKAQDTYRLTSALALAGAVVTAVATRFHGGAEPQYLSRVLPEYAANPYWTAVHLGQFLGFFLMSGALILVLNDLRQKSGSPVAILGLGAAIVAATTYAANYAADGVGIQFVARVFVEAPAPERAMALGVAEAMRHIEQGLSGLATINLGIALALCAAAIISSRVVAGGSAGPQPSWVLPSWSAAAPFTVLDFRNTLLASGPAYRCSSGCWPPPSFSGDEAIALSSRNRHGGLHPPIDAVVGFTPSAPQRHRGCGRPRPAAPCRAAQPLPPRAR